MRSRFNASAILQLDPNRRDGEAFAGYVTAHKSPRHALDFWKKKLRDASRRASHHAFDSAGDHAAAIREIEAMANHIDTRGGTKEFDPAYLGRRFMAMLKAMGSEEEGAEEGTEDGEEKRPTKEDDSTAEQRHRAATGKPSVGADGALAFDANGLFQRRAR
jgi:hypothetical protein